MRLFKIGDVDTASRPEVSFIIAEIHDRRSEPIKTQVDGRVKQPGWEC